MCGNQASSRFENKQAQRSVLIACYMPSKGPGRCGRYLNALQTNAQHLLRYLAAAVVVNKGRRNVLKELIRVVEQQVGGPHDGYTVKSCT